MVAALGVDPEGVKHVLGLAAGASENATVVKGLLEDLVRHGGQTRSAASVRDRRQQGPAQRD